MKKVPQRQCVVTHERFEKKDLIRIVRDKDGNVSIDITGKLNGKGAYISKNIEVLNKAIKSNALGRALEVEIPEEIYEELKNIINN